MHRFIIYIIESGISISLFYLFYELFFKRDTWFRFNRYFLLFGLLFSLIVPILEFSVSNELVNSHNQFEFNEYIGISTAVEVLETNALQVLPKINFVLLFYLLIISVFSIRLFNQFFKIIKKIQANEIINYDTYKLVLLKESSTPFSFFNYIFIDKDDFGTPDIPIAIGNREGSNELLLHEITHVKQKHSFDVILLEIILVLQWFNPFIYRYRQAFKEIHEYLADRGVLIKKNDKIAYQKLILSQIEKSLNVSLASQFNYSLTKNRIHMMTRIKSGKVSKLKALLILPLVAVLLMAFTVNLSSEMNIKRQDTSQMLEKRSTEIPSIFPVKRVEGVKISSGFGIRIHPISKKKMMHSAVDIKAPKETPVYATANGLVRTVKQNHTEGKGYGRYIIIDHANEYSTLYSQLSAYNVKEGQEVKQGDVIGYVGSSGLSTGSHLHYEIKKDGENVDPEKYF